MLIICDDTVTLPLKLIFNQMLATGIYPDTWKLTNVIPIHKKGDKQLVKNYRPISLLLICGKLLDQYFTTNNLITNIQSSFQSGDSTSN